MLTTKAIELSLFVAVVLAGVGFSASPAHAGGPVAHYIVRVDGMACPFCTYGLEKKLKGLPGTQNAHVELKSGLASFDAACDRLPLPASIQGAVRNAGFTPRAITLRVTGTIQGSGHQLALIVGNGQRFSLIGGKAFALVLQFVEQGKKTAVVTGTLSQAKDASVLSVEEVADAQGETTK